MQVDTKAIIVLGMLLATDIAQLANRTSDTARRCEAECTASCIRAVILRCIFHYYIIKSALSQQYLVI